VGNVFTQNDTLDLIPPAVPGRQITDTVIIHSTGAFNIKPAGTVYTPGGIDPAAVFRSLCPKGQQEQNRQKQYQR
jgi:hypothetical protein